MKRTLFALAGDSTKASSRVRAYWIAEELESVGHNCVLIPQLRRLDLLPLAIEMIKADAIIFQKNYGRYHHWLQYLAKLCGKHTYLDIDDIPSLTHAPHTMQRAAKMMRLADTVFTGSTNLKNYALEFNSDTILVPSGIKLENYPLKVATEMASDKRVCLGWIGNGHYYADDLIKILTDPLKQLAACTPLTLKIVGSCGEEKLHTAFSEIHGLEVICIDSIDWSSPAVVAEQIHSFDIGLYPLIENKVNRYKCGFKALEYMACGIPVVSSRVAINASIIDHETSGYLADTRSDWVESLDALISSEIKRNRMGLEGRKIVERNYSTKRIAQTISSTIQANRKT